MIFEARSASCQLSKRTLHFYNCMIYLTLQQSFPTVGTTIVKVNHHGHGSVCTTTKVIGMCRPIHKDSKRHRKLRSHHQSSSCIFVLGALLRSYLVKCMLGFTPFLKLKSLGDKRGNRCVVNNICYLTSYHCAKTYTDYQ